MKAPSKGTMQVTITGKAASGKTQLLHTLRRCGYEVAYDEDAAAFQPNGEITLTATVSWETKSRGRGARR